MKVSVCMGIYNGEKYIEKQLRTIYRQSRTVDEVILCDDGSIDGTVDIIKNFLQENKLEDTWKLYENTENKGYPGNFYYAMSLCMGDVVFLADQDDVWHLDKVKQMCQVFEEREDVKLVCCKFGLIDEEENTIRTVMQPTRSSDTGKLKKITIEQVFYKYVWPGMSMAYRKEWYDRKREKITSKLMIPHDFLLSVMAAEKNEMFHLDMELASHRRHDNNVGNEEHRVNKLLQKERKLGEIEAYTGMIHELQEKEILSTDNGRIALQKKITSMVARGEALKSGSLIRVLETAWKNRKLVRCQTLICDIMIVLKKC